MMYEAEFQKLKAVYDMLPEPSREAVKMIAYIPAGAMLVFGLGLMPFGIIGIGGLVMIGALSVIASVLLVAFVVPFAEETGVPQMKRQAANYLLRRKLAAGETAVTLEGEAQSFDAAPLQTAANDATEACPVQLSKEAKSR